MHHSENPNIKQFFPLVIKSISKGMEALSNDNSNYSASAIGNPPKLKTPNK